MLEALFVAASVLLVLAFSVWLWILVPMNMANARNRNALVWVLISFVGSPLLAILLLYALGEDTKG